MCRNPDGLAATAVAALKGGKVVGVVITSGGRGYTDVSVSLSLARSRSHRGGGVGDAVGSEVGGTWGIH